MSSEIVHQPLWSQTRLQTPVELYQFKSGKTHTDSKTKPLLFIGGVHGDEPEGVRLAEELLVWLQKNHIQLMRPWYVIPCINKDGYLRNTRTNSAGVDLNRNFPSQDWSTDFQFARYFPGTAPASEPEVKSLVHLIQEIQPEAIIHFHSWKPCIVYTGKTGKKWAEPFAAASGYELQEDIGYPTPGSLGQYGWLNHQIPVICIEELEGADLSSIWPRFQKAFQSLLSL